MIIADGSPSRKKEWVLTRDSFDRLLACLDADRDHAGEKYELIRRKLVKFFEWRGCQSADDYADETINRVARKLDEGEQIHHPSKYFGGVARLLLMEKLREKKAQQKALDQLSPAVQFAQETDKSDLRYECFERCLERLSRENRELITRYYQKEKRAKIDARQELAQQLGVAPNALRIRAFRIKAGLEDCVRKCVALKATK